MRFKRPFYTVSVDLACLDAAYKHVPVMISLVLLRIERNDSAGLYILSPVKKQQIDGKGILRENTEIDAFRTD
jgi:hypothetical protein